MNKWIKKLMAWITGEAKKKLTVPVLPPEDKPVTPSSNEVQVLWPHVQCDWMIHGDGTNENEIRAAAIQQAAAEGKAIRFKFRVTGTDLRFWLVWWESNVNKGKFPQGNMATPSALRAGVTKWVVDPCDDDELMIDTFKAYGDSDHQLQIVAPSARVVAGLGLDSQGVKTTPPRYRQ